MKFQTSIQHVIKLYVQYCIFRHKPNKELVVLAVLDQVNVTDFIQREPIEMKCYQHLFLRYNVQI